MRKCTKRAVKHDIARSIVYSYFYLFIYLFIWTKHFWISGFRLHTESFLKYKAEEEQIVWLSSTKWRQK